MRSITLRADWNGFSSFDGYEAVSLAADRIPLDLKDRLSAWNSDYRPLIALTPADHTTPAVADKITELDSQGRTLAAEPFQGPHCDTRGGDAFRSLLLRG
jgi:hypothetical protein